MVYAAEHTVLHQPVALKILLPEFSSFAEIETRLRREAQVSATVDSPRLVKVWDVDSTADGLPYIVMELLRGLPGRLTQCPPTAALRQCHGLHGPGL